MKSYSFTTSLDKVDFERIERENYEDGSKAFIIIGPKNAVIGIRPELLTTRSITINPFISFKVDLYIKDGYILYAFHRKKEKSGYLYTIINKNEIEIYSKRVSAAIAESEKLKKNEHKIKVLTW